MNRSEKYIPELISRAVEKGEINGASIHGSQNGRLIFHGNFGYADKEEKIKMSDNTVFRLFSMTKPVTAAASMILLERGLLRYTDKLSYYFPEYKDMDVLDENGKRNKSEKEITVRDLLSMTAGIVYPEDTPSGRIMGEIFEKTCTCSLTTEEFARLAGSCPLMFSPGEKWHYGACADIMGAVIEKISGKSLGDFLRDEIFSPLGMKDTGFYAREEKFHDLAKTYLPTENGLVPYTGINLCITDMKKPPAFESGGAGLCSTVGDYAKFAKFLLTGKSQSGEKILGKNTLYLMRRNMLSDGQKKYAREWDSLKGYGYGCFMRILEEPTRQGINSAVGEFGWDGWTGNYFSADPVNNAVFLYFIQNANTGTSDLLLRTKNIFYSDVE